MKIALDAMSGDFAPISTVKGAVEALNEIENLEVILVGKESIIKEELKKYKLPIKKIKLIESLLFISMVPLHGDYYNRQLLMLSQGLEKINQFI